MKSFFTKNFHLINFPPLFLVTIFFIIGIILHTMLTPLLILFLLSLCAALLAHAKHIALPKQLIIYSFFMCTGAWLHQQELREYDNFYTWADNKKCIVTGTVIDKNETTINHQKTIGITLAVHTIATENVAQKSNKSMLFYGKCNNSLIVGDTVTFFNIYCKKPSSENFQHYQIKEKIVATVFDNNLHYRIDNHPMWSLRYWIWNTKKRVLDNIHNKLSPYCFRFFSSLFLGNRACIKNELEETNEQFKTWGISHFLARSGLHLVLFIFIWQALLCLIPLPIIVKQSIITALSIIYFILTWTSAPFTRSFGLLLLNKICFFNKIPFHLLHYLTLVCLVFLLYCPLYLFFLDFQLSFALTFALAWFNQVPIHHKKI